MDKNTIERKSKHSKNNARNANGITLIAVVITIIILLILAKVSLSSIIGEEGIISKTKDAVAKYQEAANQEKNELDKMSFIMGEHDKQRYYKNILEILYKIKKNIEYNIELYEEINSIANRIIEICMLVANDYCNDMEKEQMKIEINVLEEEIKHVLSKMKSLKITDLQEEGFGIVEVIPIKYTDLYEESDDLVLDVTTPEKSEKTIKKANYILRKVDLEMALLGGKQNAINHSIDYYERYYDIILNIFDNNKMNKEMAMNGLANIKKMLGRCKELCDAYKNNYYSEIDGKKSIIEESKLLYNEIERTLNYTKNLDNLRLLNGDWNSNIHITMNSLGIENLVQKIENEDTDTIEKIESAISIIETALSKI